MVSKTKLHFLDGYGPSPGLLGIFGFPIAFERQHISHTRFLTLQKRRTEPNGLNIEGWTINSFDSDLVSIAFEKSERGKAWWLLGKLGNVHYRGSYGALDMQIKDAGLGQGCYGYLYALRIINGTPYACGLKRQIYKYTKDQWVHCDDSILQKDNKTDWLSDIAGTSEGTLCAVGSFGGIALGINDAFTMQDSPTNAHLQAVCVDDEGMFCAAGDYGTVIRGDANGFTTLCMDEEERSALGHRVLSRTIGCDIIGGAVCGARRGIGSI